MFNMLSEIKNLCKRIIEWIKTNNRELYLMVVIILVATISFGLGRLSKIREEKTPITIENVAVATSTEIIANTPNSQRATLTVGANKIFVASRNGKKYYYVWCDSSQKIKESNKVWFSTKEEAEKSGYQPATNCKGLK